jgi:hypothetical protein
MSEKIKALLTSQDRLDLWAALKEQTRGTDKINKSIEIIEAVLIREITSNRVFEKAKYLLTKLDISKKARVHLSTVFDVGDESKAWNDIKGFIRKRPDHDKTLNLVNAFISHKIIKTYQTELEKDKATVCNPEAVAAIIMAIQKEVQTLEEKEYCFDMLGKATGFRVENVEAYVLWYQKVFSIHKRKAEIKRKKGALVKQSASKEEIRKIISSIRYWSPRRSYSRIWSYTPLFICLVLFVEGLVTQHLIQTANPTVPWTRIRFYPEYEAATNRFAAGMTLGMLFLILPYFASRGISILDPCYLVYLAKKSKLKEVLKNIHKIPPKEISCFFNEARL